MAFVKVMFRAQFSSELLIFYHYCICLFTEKIRLYEIHKLIRHIFRLICYRRCNVESIFIILFLGVKSASRPSQDFAPFHEILNIRNVNKLFYDHILLKHCL